MWIIPAVYVFCGVAMLVYLVTDSEVRKDLMAMPSTELMAYAMFCVLMWPLTMFGDADEQ